LGPAVKLWQDSGEGLVLAEIQRDSKRFKEIQRGSKRFKEIQRVANPLEQVSGSNPRQVYVGCLALQNLIVKTVKLELEI
jgi:hypothetical protein